MEIASGKVDDLALCQFRKPDLSCWLHNEEATRLDARVYELQNGYFMMAPGRRKRGRQTRMVGVKWNKELQYL